MDEQLFRNNFLNEMSTNRLPVAARHTCLLPPLGCSQSSSRTKQGDDKENTPPQILDPSLHPPSFAAEVRRAFFPSLLAAAPNGLFAPANTSASDHFLNALRAGCKELSHTARTAVPRCCLPETRANSDLTELCSQTVKGRGRVNPRCLLTSPRCRILRLLLIKIRIFCP